MLEKGMQKTRNVFQNVGKMDAEIEKKSIENEVRKLMLKKSRMPGPTWWVGGLWRAPS